MRASCDYPQVIQSLKTEIHHLKSQLRPQSSLPPPPSLQSQLSAQASLVNNLRCHLTAVKLAASGGRKVQGLQLREIAALAAKQLQTQIESVRRGKENRSTQDDWTRISYLEKNNLVLRKRLQQSEQDQTDLEELRERVRGMREKVAGLEGRAAHMKAVIALTDRLQQERNHLQVQVQATQHLLQTRERQCLELETACDSQRPLKRKPPRPPLQPSLQDSASSGQTTARSLAKSQSWQGSPASKPIGLATRIVLLNRGPFLPSSESLTSYI